MSERRKIAQELLNMMESSPKALQPGLFHAATLLDPAILQEGKEMQLVTFVATVELGSSLEETASAIKHALEATGAQLPETEWIPDKDTICDAYEADSMHVEIINP